MVQPTELLKDLGMVGVALKYPSVCSLGSFEFLLLFINVTNLKPDIFFGQRSRWVGDNVFEALRGN